MSSLLDRIAAIARSHALPVKSRVLLALLCYADKSGQAHPSMGRLARDIGSTEATVRRCCTQLRADGLISCRERGRGGRGRGMTVWTVAPNAEQGAWLQLIKGGRSGHPSGERGADPDGDPDEKPHPERPPLPPQRGAEPARECEHKPVPCSPPLDAKGGPNRSERVAISAENPGRNGYPNYQPRTTEGTTVRGTLGSGPPDGLGSPAASGPLTGELWEELEANRLAPSANSIPVLHKLRRASSEGMTRADLGRLCGMAQGGDNPIGLMLHWLGTPELWRDVLTGDNPAARFNPAPSRGSASAGDVLRRFGS